MPKLRSVIDDIKDDIYFNFTLEECNELQTWLNQRIVELNHAKSMALRTEFEGTPVSNAKADYRWEPFSITEAKALPLRDDDPVPLDNIS